MERESDYDNDGLDPSEEYFRKKKKGNKRITIFLMKNLNHLIIKSKKNRILNTKYREI